MIKLLSQNLINQIAAGEVIERPASVIKELVENAIDAGATEIEVKIQDAGKSLISVSDNGCGMDKDSLKLCILSHATSKLSNENLFDIHTFGFRGEALPSMVSIARVSITSSDNEEGDAWKLNTEGKDNLKLELESRTKGTTVTVRDLFYTTPARLKFLKSDNTESEACNQTLNRIALAFRNVSFTLYDKDIRKFSYNATNNLKQRIKDIFGETFSENLFEVKIEKGSYSLYGFVGVPTFNKPSSNYQYFFVNNRFVKDKIFALALRSAYSGLVPSGRYPVAILFLDIPHNEVDVNAHPAKIEIRFKEVEAVRGFLISSLKRFITTFGASKPSTEVVNNVFHLNNSQKSVDHKNKQSSEMSDLNVLPLKDVHQSLTWTSNSKIHSRFSQNYENKQKLYNSGLFSPQKDNKLFNDVFQKSSCKNPKFEEDFAKSEKEAKQDVIPETSAQFMENSETKINLGTALYQIANTYIVAATNDSLILVDQHAVAERITLEKLKKSTKLDSQDLLLPEICPLSESKVELFEKNSELIAKFGIVYEKMSPDVIMVNALPSILGSCDAKPLINDIADELENMGDIYSLDEKIHLILSTMSCHGSLRAGRKLSVEEMNSLLRQMESTENIAQCCHGRPSYIVLTTKNLNKFFERT